MADWFNKTFQIFIVLVCRGLTSGQTPSMRLLYMTVISFIIGGLVLLGPFLVLTGPRGVIENKFVFQILDKINFQSSVPPFHHPSWRFWKASLLFIVGTNLVWQQPWFHCQLRLSYFFARQDTGSTCRSWPCMLLKQHRLVVTLWDTIKVYLVKASWVGSCITVTLIS